jgi:hypothetical protein
MNDDLEAGAEDQLQEQSQAKSSKRLTIALVHSQLETAVAQIKQDQNDLARTITASVLEALRLQAQQAQQPIPGPGPEAKQAEQEHAQQHQQQAAQRQGQSTNFRPDVAFGQLGVGDFDAGQQDQFQPDGRATFGESFANLLGQGYAARQAGGKSKGGGHAVQADDDSPAVNPTWRPNYVVAKTHLSASQSLCSANAPALVDQYGSVHAFLENSILRDKWNERDKHEAAVLALILDSFFRASVDLRAEYCELVYRRFVGIVYHAKDGSWTLADELLRPFQKFHRLVDDDVTDSALLLAATRAKIEAQNAPGKKRNGDAKKAEDKKAGGRKQQ